MEEVQLRRLCTRLINATFILLRWGNMEAVQKDYWYFVVLLFLPFLKGAVQQTNGETVRLEEGMVLDCLCPWDGQLSMVSWTKVPQKNPFAVYSPKHGVSLHHQYIERVEFLKVTPMDGSISLKNVTHQDIGLYHCSVHTFPHGSWTRDIWVEDLDEPPEDNVTEAPTLETFQVDSQLVAEHSSNLTISCNKPQNSTVYMAYLEKLMFGKRWLTVGECKMVDQGVEITGMMDCTESLDINVILTNVTSEDDGFYRCSYKTDRGIQNTIVQLTVAPPAGFSLSLYMMYIYLGAGAAGLVLIISFLILGLRRRKKKRRKEYRVKLHPSQRQDCEEVQTD
ncbi:PREDICTED: CD226 antigen isoform X2 [Cyprinodon variegatus]|uniref:CD226 antigen isoform X2 n=1 Tax=Cyprinodon variegatus TaxID=28743 RepID=UPI0007424FB2|nr:PREDICTED: CD226 antigen isoform X2 [Cyprinodon variegatus]